MRHCRTTVNMYQSNVMKVCVKTNKLNLGNVLHSSSLQMFFCVKKSSFNNRFKGVSMYQRILACNHPLLDLDFRGPRLKLVCPKLSKGAQKFLIPLTLIELKNVKSFLFRYLFVTFFKSCRTGIMDKRFSQTLKFTCKWILNRKPCKKPTEISCLAIFRLKNSL